MSSHLGTIRPPAGRRGSSLITVLLLMTILLILGLAYLTQKTHLYKASSTAERSAVAKALAEAGLEDARVKLEKDPNFPPTDGQTQLVYSYTEGLTNVGGTELVGSYTVSVDLRRLEANGVKAITSTGLVDRDTSQPVQHQMYAEVDCSSDYASNSKFFRFITVEDRGGI